MKGCAAGRHIARSASWPGLGLIQPRNLDESLSLCVLNRAVKPRLLEGPLGHVVTKDRIAYGTPNGLDEVEQAIGAADDFHPRCAIFTVPTPHDIWRR
jgi:hypothetical protein